jgi:peptidoglycan/xylan/chitin deacetylase (PgdA/CDA1 family)
MTILCYHSVDPDWTSPLAVDPADFEQQCAWLSRHRRVIPLTQAVQQLGTRGRLPPRTVALTFDDGFAALHTHALPVLARYGLPATVFLVAQTLTAAGQTVDWVDTPPPWTLQTLTTVQVKEMQHAGVEFASHSWAHRDLTTLSFDDCLEDLRRSRELLEDLLGHPVPFLAYPRGRNNADVRAAAAGAGYTHSFTLPETVEHSDPQGVPRVGIYQGNSVATLAVKCQRSYLGVRTHPSYAAARRLLATVRRR